MDYPNGALYRAVYSDRTEYFYKDGTLKTVERWDGESVLYWPNGQIKRKCEFVKGKRVGWDRMWSEEGKLVDEEFYG